MVVWSYNSNKNTTTQKEIIISYTDNTTSSYESKPTSKVNSLKQFLFHYELTIVGRQIENVEACVSHRELVTATTTVHSLDDHLCVWVGVCGWMGVWMW